MSSLEGMGENSPASGFVAIMFFILLFIVVPAYLIWDWHEDSKRIDARATLGVALVRDIDTGKAVSKDTFREAFPLGTANGDKVVRRVADTLKLTPEDVLRKITDSGIYVERKSDNSTQSSKSQPAVDK